MPSTCLGPDLALVRASEIGANSGDMSRLLANTSKERQKWLKDPREIHVSDRLHQVPLVDGAGLAGIAWDHTKYRHQWHRNGTPIARPLTCGGLTFNEQSQWWERNGSSWQPEKKSKGGHQTAIDLRHLGVVLQPRISRLLGKAKASLGFSSSVQNTGLPKEDPRGVPTIVFEVSNPETVAEKTFNLTAKSHILYTRKEPLRLPNLLRRKTCRHPSTCTLHPHLNVDVPQTIDIPLVEEPEKLETAQSAFVLRSCQHIGHEHLSHEQDPCFSDAKGEGIDVQNQEDIIRQVSDLAATDIRMEGLEKIWQREEERERQEEMLMTLPSPHQKENRPPSVSAQTLFHNAAKSLQQHSLISDPDGEQEGSFYSRTASALHLRGGSGRKRYAVQPCSWRMREWFTGVRREPVCFIHSESDKDDDRRRNGGRQVRHRVMHAREAGMTDREWASLPVLHADNIETFLDHHEHVEAGSTRNVARRRPNWTFHDERSQPQEAEHVGTLSNEARGGFEYFGNSSLFLPHSRSGSRSNARSGSPGSVEVIRDINIQREQPAPSGEAYGREQPGPYLGGPEADNPRTRREWAQWDGRTHSSGAAVLTRSPGGRRNDRFDTYIIDREPGLGGGFGGRQRPRGRGLGGAKVWAV